MRIKNSNMNKYCEWVLWISIVHKNSLWVLWIRIVHKNSLWVLWIRTVYKNYKIIGIEHRKRTMNLFKEIIWNKKG